MVLDHSELKDEFLFAKDYHFVCVKPKNPTGTVWNYFLLINCSDKSINKRYDLRLQKIADFGLATQLTVPDEKHFTMCGTPNYISP